MTEQPFTLKQGDRTEGPGSVVVFRNGSRFPLNSDEDFAHLLISFSARAATALAEIFPEPKALLGLTEEERFGAVPSTSYLHEHFSRLARDYCRAIQDLQTDEYNTRALEKRNYSAALIQGYCSLAYIAHKLVAADLTDEDDFTGVALIALASQNAPYVTRDEWETYEQALVAAMIAEAKLPLEIRLKLDGDGPLPTERVRQRRPRRKTALKAHLPWVVEFLSSSLNITLYRAAALLEADVSYSEGTCSLLTRRLP